MRNNQYEIINKFAKEILNYFSELKKERTLTKEEQHFIFSAMTVMQIVRNDKNLKLDRQYAHTEKERKRSKEMIFKLNKIVYEGIVYDIYEPVYAANHTDLKRKMSRFANETPQKEDTATVNVYVNGVKCEKQLWIRKNELNNGTWTFGAWLRIEPKN
jgi:hypothetical protein